MVNADNRFVSGPRLVRAAVAGVAATAALILLAAPALAHITITPASAAAGSAAELTLRIPNEEATASTVKVDVLIPTAHPIAQLLVKPVPGWSVTVKTITLARPLVTDDGSFSQAVSEVIWSGGRIAPGQYQDFSISADPLPDVPGQLVFKAIQTYSNGDVVRWIDLSQPGQTTAGHPAPVLLLTSGTGTATQAAAPAAGSAAADPASSGGTSVLAIASLAVAIVALVVAGMSLWRKRTTGG